MNYYKKNNCFLELTGALVEQSAAFQGGFFLLSHGGKYFGEIGFILWFPLHFACTHL